MDLESLHRVPLRRQRETRRVKSLVLFIKIGRWMEDLNDLTGKIIGCAIDVHKILGPGLLESAYEECLSYELEQNRIAFERQKPIPVNYKSIKLDAGYRIDILVENKVVLELKSIDLLAPIHTAQILTYLKFSEKKIGLLINFNVTKLKDGIKRYVL